MQGHSHYPQMFGTQALPHLLKQQYTPNPQQLQFAKLSLIQKHKAASGIQQLLLCRSSKGPQQQLLTMNEKTMIETEKKKYIDYVRKNYNQKITEQLTSLNKLKSRIKEFERKNEEQRRQEQQEKEGNNMMQQQVARKRRKNEEGKVTAGKKKVKTEQQTKKETKSKKTKNNKEGMKEQVNQILPEIIDIQNKGQQELQDLNSEIDLLNSLSQDDLNYQDDE